MADADETAVQSLWSRIRHRKVAQWSLAYLAAAWGLVQGVEFAVATFHWPEALTRMVAVTATVGLPVTVVLAWFHGDRGHQRVVRAELLILVALLLGGGLLVRQVAVQPPAEKDLAAPRKAAEPARLDRHRLAVLPFANLGDDPANAAFVGGVHDTLITQIAKVPGLTVISRSSVLQFEGRKPTIAEVAAALVVGAVLEGSVQRDGQRLRIQAQLIDASSDAHLWAETYDRNAGDLFAVQSEIAQAVAEQLRIHLTGGDSERLTASLTSNPQAYEHYAVGRSLMSRPGGGTNYYEDPVREFVAAVTLDPRFAAAHAQLSIARTWLAFNEASRRKDVLPLAKASAEHALEIDPTLPEGHLAKAVYLYRGEPDLPAAAAEFETAIAGLPNDAFAHQNFGYLRSYQGRFEEAAALFARATELDPRGPAFPSLINMLAFLGRRDDALAAIARARAAQPDNVEFPLRGGLLAMDFDCDLHAWQAALDAMPAQRADDGQVLGARWFFSLSSGDYQKAIEYAERMAKTNTEDDFSDQLGWTYTLAGRTADAAKQYRRYVQRALLNLRDRPSGDAAALEMAYVARAYAFLGDRANAVSYANRAVAALPPSGAFRQRPPVLLISAAALAYVGELAAARELYRQLLELPFDVKPPGIWCDPMTAPLRSDPAFRTMMSEHGADLSIDPHRRETWPKPAGRKPAG